MFIVYLTTTTNLSKKEVYIKQVQKILFLNPVLFLSASKRL